MKTRTLRYVAAAVALLLTLPACSGGTEEAAAPSPTITASPEPLPSPSPSPSPTPEPGVPRPLNGLRTEDEASLDRRVIAVKIDNHALARPQSGIDHADAVVELLVEGGLTRFIALFHSEDPDFVGPMRSGRPTDPTILRPLDAVFAISGAQAWVLDRIRAAGVPIIGEVGRPATFRSSSKRAPHNLFVDVGGLREVAASRGYDDDPPPTWFDFAPWDEDEGTAAGDILMRWSTSTTVTWHLDDGAYERIQDGDAHVLVSRDGDFSQVTADTLVVLEADRYTARPPGRGSAVPAMDTVGTGRAMVFHDGRVVEGSWSRDSDAEVFRLTGLDGEPLPVPPGRLWVSIFPADRLISW